MTATTTRKRAAGRKPAAVDTRKLASGNGKAAHANGKNGKAANAVNIPRGETAAESPEWRRFVGQWLEAHECKVEAAPRNWVRSAWSAWTACCAVAWSAAAFLVSAVTALMSACS